MSLQGFNTPYWPQLRDFAPPQAYGGTGFQNWGPATEPGSCFILEGFSGVMVGYTAGTNASFAVFGPTSGGGFTGGLLEVVMGGGPTNFQWSGFVCISAGYVLQAAVPSGLSWAYWGHFEPFLSPRTLTPF